MATRAATTRLGKEAKMMDKDPPQYCYARPREDDLLEWHFILRGPPQTPYEGGEYWGQLLFPPEYPFKPPGIKVSTPSGRFHVNTKICTSMSDFHPGSWNPAWSVASIVVGLLSFMCSDEITTGSVMATHQDRCTLAKRSHEFNIKQPRFRKMFPEYTADKMRDLPNMDQKTNSANGSVSKGAEASTTGNTAAESRSTLQPSPAAPRSAPTASNALESAERRQQMSTSNRGAQTSNVGDVQQQRAANTGGQGRSRALVSVIVALAAYLFISRLASILESGTLSS